MSYQHPKVTIEQVNMELLQASAFDPEQAIRFIWSVWAS